MIAQATTVWNDHSGQQLVRYEAMFKLLDEIQQLETVEEISRRAAQQWKYFANVASWRLVLPWDSGFAVIDGVLGEARLSYPKIPEPWDAHHLMTRIPRLVQSDRPPLEPLLPDHLSGKDIAGIEVLPFLRLGRCIGLLTVSARHKPFSEMDRKFIRIFGSHFTDRLAVIQSLGRAMETLNQKARQDVLTGLLNRGAILEQLDNQLALSIARDEPLGVILADVDFFKSVNDNHGHQVGDHVLRTVAGQLQSQCMPNDCVGRYGGEEFLLVLPCCTPETLAQVSERLRRAVAESPIRTCDNPHMDLLVTVSLGAICVTGSKPVDLEALIKRADNALYASKRSGRNRVTVDRMA